MDPEPLFWGPLATSALAGAATGIGGLLVVAMGQAPSRGHLAFALALAGSVMVTVSVFDMLLPFMLKEGATLPLVVTLAGAASFRLLSIAVPEPSADMLLPWQSAKRAARPRVLENRQEQSTDPAI